VDVSLTEGIAEMVSGGMAGDRVTSRAVLAELVDTYGVRNPIAMHQYRYPSIEGIAYNYYYPMFELAVTYLFDPDGHGQSPEAFRDLLLDVRDGMPFARAFEDRLGISLASYEANFFDLMDAYLN
jgi:hypothetical protein